MTSSIALLELTHTAQLSGRPCITKGSCTYYVITDRGGVSPNDYGITLASSQIITVLHRGGPANDYGIREAVKNVLADFFC